MKAGASFSLPPLNRGPCKVSTIQAVTPEKMVICMDLENEKKDSLFLLTCLRAGRLLPTPSTPTHSQGHTAGLSHLPKRTRSRLPSASQQLLPLSLLLGRGHVRLGSSTFPGHLLRTDGMKSCRKGDSFQGPRVDSCLTLRN